MEQTTKLRSLADAVASVEDGMQLALGGWIFNSQPMALVRALIRRGRKDLRLLPSPGSIAPDMLIGAGAVREIACSFISFEQFGLAPHFRRAAESGAIVVRELDGPALACGLRAAACDLPYGFIPDLGTDLPRVNPEMYRILPREPGARPLIAVPALVPDVVFLHGQRGDRFGNVQLAGGVFFDPQLAQAAKHVIVTV